MTETCTHVRADETRCRNTLGLIDGICVAHREGGTEKLRERAALGGEATKRKLDGGGFNEDEIVPLITIEDAKLAHDQIRRGIMTRRCTHAEGNAASKAVDNWVRTETAAITQRLVTELRVEMEAKTAEIETLRKQLATRSQMRAMK